ncbi:hypothetical protein HA402_012992 [Bradysia odoriphaga]|nr:hypothetical protein HA402_012992 [Bradysia odoriphaga]
MLYHLIVGAIVPALVLGYQVVPCPDHLPINAPPIDIEIPGCPSTPCHVTRGTNITYQVRFFAAVDTPRMGLHMNSTVFGVESPVELPPELRDACNTIVEGCPVTEGQILTQRATIPVTSDFGGGIPAQLKFYISHDPGFYCTCAMVNIVIH